MLPWKKHKFELLAEAPPRQASKPKGYAVSLHYSALSSLARACPEGALSRVGSMFRSKRKKLHITSEDPTYTVLYLGNATTIQARGDGCTDLAVGKIWSKSEAGRQGTKMKLTVSAQGIRMVHAEERALRRPGHLYLLHRVTYCVADARLPKVFAWVYRHELKHKAVMLRCHAVLVSKPEKAQAMALLLYQTSANALAEFKRLKRRDDARHQQQELVGAHTIPLVPLRKLLLHGPCCYKPPVERSRSAPKLGSITEDLLGEQQEQELQEEEEEEEHPEGCPEEEENHAAEGDSAEEAEAPRALVVAMHFECGDLLDTLENGRGEAPGGGGGSLGPGARPPPLLLGSASDMKAELSQLISDLGELSFGNDVRTLQADLQVTRLLWGDSTGSESSIEGGGPDATAGDDSGQADGASADDPDWD
ncbi:PREDICTED: protein FAM43A [Colobus angolensis palliatus]|uniref:PID domain-containing protein n=1 Tax=Colobus angolensis palliatus TaxID=336983 RepID=A0A2K5HLK5_COLAP|nr:PREDICTED: protein FAM43A [Colobus angolensis palliatus]